MLARKAITADDKEFHALGVHDVCRAKVGEFFFFFMPPPVTITTIHMT